MKYFQTTLKQWRFLFNNILRTPAGESHSINHDRNWPPSETAWLVLAALCLIAAEGRKPTLLPRGLISIDQKRSRKVETMFLTAADFTVIQIARLFLRICLSRDFGARAHAVQLWVHRIPQGPTIYNSGSWKAWLPVETTSRDGNCQIFPLEFQRGKNPRILWKPKCLYRVDKSPPLASVLRDKAGSIVRYSTDHKFTNLLDTIIYIIN